MTEYQNQIQLRLLSFGLCMVVQNYYIDNFLCGSGSCHENGAAPCGFVSAILVLTTKKSEPFETGPFIKY
jgi:hypothetical protein